MGRKNVTLPDGTELQNYGQGTWYMGSDPEAKALELKTLRLGIDRGITVIDTAEMYGNGAAEKLVGEAIRPYKREDLFLISKVLPNNAGEKNIFKSCEQSLKHLQTDYLDLYLLHWRGSIPLQETVACLEKLVQAGKIKRWGVSNFDTADMKELLQIRSGKNCAVNEVLYHLGSRGIEFDLLPYLKTKHIPVIAYCPLAQAGKLKKNLLQDASVKKMAAKYQLKALQILLCFVLAQENMLAIPKTASPSHLAENLECIDISFDEEDLELLNRAFPAPSKKTYLDIV